MTDPVAPHPPAPLTHRFVALVIVVTAVSIVWVLAGLEPDRRGHGTHEQLGLSRCSWPETLDLPCPTCGCTTAATHLVQLSPWRAVTTQPFGAFIAASGLLFAGMAFASLVRRTSFVERIAMMPYGTITLVAIGVFLASWLYKYLTWESGNP